MIMFSIPYKHGWQGIIRDSAKAIGIEPKTKAGKIAMYVVGAPVVGLIGGTAMAMAATPPGMVLGGVVLGAGAVKLATDNYKIRKARREGEQK